MPDTPHDRTHDLGDGTPASLDALQQDGVLSIFGTIAEAAALDMPEDLAAYDAELIARDDLDTLTSDRAGKLSAFKAAQAVERKAAIRHAKQDSDLIGFVLATFRKLRAWSREQLADWLGVSADDFGRLAFEVRPRAVNT